MKEEIRVMRAENLRPYFELGLSFAEISRRAGVCAKTVTDYATYLGFKTPEREPITGRPSKKAQRKEQLEAMAREGKTQQEVADELGITRTSISKYAQEYGIKFRRPMENYNIDFERAEVMAAMFGAGKTLAEIGEVYGVTRERVRQIIKSRHGMTGTDGGYSIISSKKKSDKLLKKQKKHLERFGCTIEQRDEIIRLGNKMFEEGLTLYRTPTRAWSNQRNNALRRGIEWKLTLWDWWQVWQRSGKWEQRGRGKGEYVMCRFADAGAYEVGNVYIATMSHNATVQPNNPYRKSHPDHAEAIAKIIDKLRGNRRTVRKRKYHDLPVGVVKQKNRFIARLCCDGKTLHLGSFSTPEEAGAAYQAKLAEIELRAAA